VFPVFVLANGRSGTRFLCDLFLRNVSNCVCVHEPYFDRMNPSMFGESIYHLERGNREEIRKLLRRKKEGISRYYPRVYVETSHAFLKSFYDVAVEFFPEMKLVHLIRHPLETAMSEANRETAAHRFHFPFRFYWGDDGRRYYRWSLTGREAIFREFRDRELTLFERYLIQWIEIENRAMNFLDRFDKHDACFTLHSPNDLNDPLCVSALFRFLGLDFAGDRLVIAGSRNPTPRARTLVQLEDKRRAAEVIADLPPAYLSIFAAPPYSSREWANLLIKPSQI
jgi:hypothetical protein